MFLALIAFWTMSRAPVAVQTTETEADQEAESVPSLRRRLKRR